MTIIPEGRQTADQEPDKVEGDRGDEIPPISNEITLFRPIDIQAEIVKHKWDWKDHGYSYPFKQHVQFSDQSSYHRKFISPEDG